MGNTSAAVKNKYNQKTYDRLEFIVKKGQKEIIQEYAKAKGMNVSAYVNSLIWADMGIKEETEED